MALAGTLLTLLLPETSRRSLEDISDETRIPTPTPRLVPAGIHAEAA
jgi:hypothetical protein